MIIDISPALHPGTATWPGDAPLRRTQTADIDPDGYRLSQLSGTPHLGAHVDAPAHTLADGSTIDQLDLSSFFGPCLVVDLEDLHHAPLTPRLLVRTGYPRDRTRFHERFRGIPLDALARFTGLRLVGTDAPGVDPFDSDDLPVHRWLARRGLPSIEGLDLSQVTPGAYTLIALPLRLVGAEASPVRAALSPAAP